MAWEAKPVSFSANTLEHTGDTATYTIQKGNTLGSLAKELASETGKTFTEAYKEILVQNNYYDEKLNPAGDKSKDPNKIEINDVVKFSYDEKLSTYCKASEPPADKVQVERDTDAAAAMARQTARFGDCPLVFAACTEVPAEDVWTGDDIYGVSREGDDNYAEQFYTNGEHGVEEVSEFEAYEALTSRTEPDYLTDFLSLDTGAIGMNSSGEVLDSGLPAEDVGQFTGAIGMNSSGEVLDSGLPAEDVGQFTGAISEGSRAEVLDSGLPTEDVTGGGNFPYSRYGGFPAKD